MSEETSSSASAELDTPLALSDEQRARRNRRNMAVALGLVAFITLVYVITMARLGLNIASRGA
ncbi:MAG: hypothetical protein AAF527_04650 [Pseudomonadota bacterium]